MFFLCAYIWTWIPEGVPVLFSSLNLLSAAICQDVVVRHGPLYQVVSVINGDTVQNTGTFPGAEVRPQGDGKKVPGQAQQYLDGPNLLHGLRENGSDNSSRISPAHPDAGCFCVTGA